MTEQVPEPAGPVVPTQVARPWQATFRTAWEVGVPAFLVLLGILPAVLQAVVDGMGSALPPAAVGWLAGAAAFITLLAATLARIAAIPGVDKWLEAVGLDAAGRGTGRHIVRD
jgi:hypothetical protein